MKHTISKNRRTLTITVDEEERKQLREIDECDVSMHDFLELLRCNSDLQWIDVRDTGDLTDTPMLGLLTEPEFKRHSHAILDNQRNIICNCSIDGLIVVQVSERWAFMDYQVRSGLEDLRDKGQAVFIGGAL